jgi:hypothetical protein
LPFNARRYAKYKDIDIYLWFVGKKIAEIRGGIEKRKAKIIEKARNFPRRRGFVWKSAQ